MATRTTSEDNTMTPEQRTTWHLNQAARGAAEILANALACAGEPRLMTTFEEERAKRALAVIDAVRPLLLSKA